MKRLNSDLSKWGIRDNKCVGGGAGKSGCTMQPLFSYGIFLILMRKMCIDEKKDASDIMTNDFSWLLDDDAGMLLERGDLSFPRGQRAHPVPGSSCSLFPAHLRLSEAL